MEQLTPPPKSSSRQGFALVLVLCALVLVSILVVAYLSSVSTELQSSKAYASGAYTRQLADIAENLVIAQIKEATSQTGDAWCSQPGLIRTYNTQGSLDKMYKLYSSNQWRVSGTFDPTADIPADWNQRPADYTDLNSPVLDNSGTASFPILDGNLKTLTVNGVQTLTYDSNNDSLPDITGFGIPLSSVPTYQSASPISASNNPVPMPVQWMYVLSNGDINTASAATGTNPIVARVAFWTDDETCKVNVNTASEGSFWDMPLTPGGDGSLADYAVQAKEYQRYPGHPATTSLSPILSCLLSNTSATTATNDLRNFIYGLAPRVSGRGSQAGSRYAMTTSSFPVTPDHDRLYDSVDELAFLPEVSGSTSARYEMTSTNLQTLRAAQLDWNYTGTAFTLAGSAYNFSQAIQIDEHAISRLRFFLTAQSRAPELNLLNRPRVSLWPVDTRSAYISPVDKTLAFCSTIGGKPFYFQRQNPKSPTEDYNNIQRNQDLYAYLQGILGNPIPGFGTNTFATKYAGGESDQILTEIFDWVRSGVNLAYPDATVQPYAFYPNAAAAGTVSPPGLPGSGQVTPIVINNTRGFGRFPTVSKVAYELVMENQQPGVPAAGQTTLTMRFAVLLETYVPMIGYAGYVPDYTVSINGLAGSPAIHVYDATNHTSPNPTDQKIMADTLDGAIKMSVPSNVEPYFGRAWGGDQGYITPFLYLDSSHQLQPRTLRATDSTSGYPFVSSPNEIKFVVSGSTANQCVSIDPFSFTLQITDNDPAGPNIVQTFQPSFPGVTGLMLPVLTGSLQDRVNQISTVSGSTPSSGGASNYAAIASKSVIVSGSGGGDIVRGLEVSHGDLRLLAVRKQESSTTSFVPHVSYSGTVALAHTLLRPSGAVEGSEYTADSKEMVKSTHIPKRGVLVVSSTFVSSARNCRPQAPSDQSKVTGFRNRGYFDFSTGISNEGDGPLIIKPDEGNASFGGYNWAESSIFPYQNQLFPFSRSYLLSTFSPNREVASPVQLGTLPTGAVANGTGTETPWQTLLFRPILSSATPPHPGSVSPADHLLLDLFWMPVVDPYPISEPFSTAGKINMNCQIMPFTYIQRDTGIRAVLKATRITAAMTTDPVNSFTSYKDVTLTPSGPSALYDIDPDKTLLFFSERFADSTQQAFKSASEICTIPLVPKQRTTTSINTGHPDNVPTAPLATIDLYGATDTTTLRTRLATFWNTASLSGDNMMESPYNQIYPRLTTKSNTYTIHVRVQGLKKVSGTPINTFVDPNDPNAKGRKDLITGEYRGSFVIERYIDPNDTRFQAANAAYVNPDTGSLDQMYKFRVINTKQFAP